MNRWQPFSRMALAILILASAANIGFAQANPGNRNPAAQGMSQRFESSHPQVGETLPDIAAFDRDGNEWKLSSLRGHYTVLVFGCLT